MRKIKGVASFAIPIIAAMLIIPLASCGGGSKDFPGAGTTFKVSDYFLGYKDTERSNYAATYEVVDTNIGDIYNGLISSSPSISKEVFVGKKTGGYFLYNYNNETSTSYYDEILIMSGTNVGGAFSLLSVDSSMPFYLYGMVDSSASGTFKVDLYLPDLSLVASIDGGSNQYTDLTSFDFRQVRPYYNVIDRYTYGEFVFSLIFASSDRISTHIGFKTSFTNDYSFVTIPVDSLPKDTLPNIELDGKTLNGLPFQQTDMLGTDGMYYSYLSYTDYYIIKGFDRDGNQKWATPVSTNMTMVSYSKGKILLVDTYNLPGTAEEYTYSDLEILGSGVKVAQNFYSFDYMNGSLTKVDFPYEIVSIDFYLTGSMSLEKDPGIAFGTKLTVRKIIGKNAQPINYSIVVDGRGSVLYDLTNTTVFPTSTQSVVKYADDCFAFVNTSTSVVERMVDANFRPITDFKNCTFISANFEEKYFIATMVQPDGSTKYGVVSFGGKIILNFTYEILNIAGWPNRLIYGQTNGSAMHYGYIDLTGKVILDADTYDNVSYFSENGRSLLVVFATSTYYSYDFESDSLSAVNYNSYDSVGYLTHGLLFGYNYYAATPSFVAHYELTIMTYAFESLFVVNLASLSAPMSLPDAHQDSFYSNKLPTLLSGVFQTVSSDGSTSYVGLKLSVTNLFI